MTSLSSLFVVIRGPFDYNAEIVDALQGLKEVKVDGEKAMFRVRIPWPNVIARTGNEGADRRFEDKGFAFNVFRPDAVLPDKWSGFEWARD